MDLNARKLDELFSRAIHAAGDNPNALGFMQRIPDSIYYRQPPRGWPQRQDDTPTYSELKKAESELLLAIRTGRWL